MKDRPGKVTVRFPHDPPRRIYARLVGRYCAAHRTIKSDGVVEDCGCWTVTHRPTGRRLAECSCRDHAIAAAGEFERLLPAMLGSLARYVGIKAEWEMK